MQVTAQGLRHHALLFLSFGVFFAQRALANFKIGGGRGSLGNKIWSCMTKDESIQLHRRGSREVKVALVILSLESP